jgi:hypothetical protein
VVSFPEEAEGGIAGKGAVALEVLQLYPQLPGTWAEGEAELGDASNPRVRDLGRQAVHLRPLHLAGNSPWRVSWCRFSFPSQNSDSWLPKPAL